MCRKALSFAYVFLPVILYFYRTFTHPDGAVAAHEMYTRGLVNGDMLQNTEIYL